MFVWHRYSPHLPSPHRNHYYLNVWLDSFCEKSEVKCWWYDKVRDMFCEDISLKFNIVSSSSGFWVCLGICKQNRMWFVFAVDSSLPPTTRPLLRDLPGCLSCLDYYCCCFFLLLSRGKREKVHVSCIVCVYLWWLGVLARGNDSSKPTGRTKLGEGWWKEGSMVMTISDDDGDDMILMMMMIWRWI